MDEITRRQAMKAASVAGLLFTARAVAEEEDGVDMSRDRRAVLAAGMTDDEADCWELAARTAGAFFELEEMHPTDAHEVATAIHVVQNKLLSRPTYRRYMEEVKK